MNGEKTFFSRSFLSLFHALTKQTISVIIFRNLRIVCTERWMAKGQHVAFPRNVAHKRYCQTLKKINSSKNNIQWFYGINSSQNSVWYLWKLMLNENVNCTFVALVNDRKKTMKQNKDDIWITTYFAIANASVQNFFDWVFFFSGFVGFWHYFFFGWNVV